MTPHQYMSEHVHQLPEGGIAWHRRIFTSASALDPVTLIDAAVDIAWTVLMPNTLERPLLEIKEEGERIVFRLQPSLPFAIRRARRPGAEAASPP